MRIPVIRGLIDRRILINFRIDPDVLAQTLPQPFRPKLVNGYAIGGICLIRLKGIRPRFFPLPWGIGSENAAHRFAVQWDVDGQTQEGVYIQRRDTDSRINSIVGGRIFPGVHHHASFKVEESVEKSEHRFSVAMQSDDGINQVNVVGTLTDHLPASSVFTNLAAASEFFELGSLGFSDTRTEGRFDGIELRCNNWEVETLEIEKVESSYFDDETRFPPGSVEFDSALLMRRIDHQWHSREALCSQGL